MKEEIKKLWNDITKPNIKEQLEEVIKKNLPEEKEVKPHSEIFNPNLENANTYGFNQAISKIDTKLIADEVLKVVEVTENTSDGYHTFKELYEYRKLYNAGLFNEWSKQGLYNVHKSERHSDGEQCFGGGWFIVVATLPTGDISNHYEMSDWNLFNCEIREKAKEWDGHTPQDVAKRLNNFLLTNSSTIEGEQSKHLSPNKELCNCSDLQLDTFGEHLESCHLYNSPNKENEEEIKKHAWEWFDNVQKKISEEPKLIVKRKGKKNKW